MKSPSPPKPRDSQPVELPRWRYRLLGAAIAMEAAWVAILAALAVAR
jgi:hypothetical protein